MDELEARRARIMGIVERSAQSKICPLCRYNRFKGGIHPYAGKNAPSKAEQKWCTGKAVIQPKTPINEVDEDLGEDPI
jgi:hypothetical protein